MGPRTRARVLRNGLMATPVRTWDPGAVFGGEELEKREPASPLSAGLGRAGGPRLRRQGESDRPSRRWRSRQRRRNRRRDERKSARHLDRRAHAAHHHLVGQLLDVAAHLWGRRRWNGSARSSACCQRHADWRLQQRRQYPRSLRRHRAGQGIVYDATTCVLDASPRTVGSALWLADSLGTAIESGLWTSAVWDISDDDGYALGLIGPAPTHIPSTTPTSSTPITSDRPWSR
jgi:hypothetical protein